MGTSVLIVRKDAQLLICPLGGVWIREVPQHSVGVMPKAPENPKPHGCAEDLAPDHLGPGQLGKLSVLGLDVHSAAGTARERAVSSGRSRRATFNLATAQKLDLTSMNHQQDRKKFTRP